MLRRIGRVLALGAVYVGVVVLATLLFLVASTLVGYLPYSDRPGPGWHGTGLTWRELGFFASFSVLLIPSLAIWGFGLAVLGQILAALRSPRWFLGIVGALLGGYLTLVTVAGVGWYIAIAAGPVYAAAVAGVLFGALVFPRLSTGKTDRPSPSPAYWLACVAVTTLAIGGVYARFLAPHFSQRLSIQFVRVDPGEQPLGDSLLNSGLTEHERTQLTTMFPHGVARFGLSGFAGGSGGAQARMLVIVTGTLPPHSSLRQPKGGDVVYVQKGTTWQRFPDDAALVSDAVEIWPSAKDGRIKVKYFPGEPTEFGFFVPTTP